jgi:hypothetical protein
MQGVSNNNSYAPTVKWTARQQVVCPSNKQSFRFRLPFTELKCSRITKYGNKTGSSWLKTGSRLNGREKNSIVSVYRFVYPVFIFYIGFEINRDKTNKIGYTITVGSGFSHPTFIPSASRGGEEVLPFNRFSDMFTTMRLLAPWARECLDEFLAICCDITSFWGEFFFQRPQ